MNNVIKNILGASVVSVATVIVLGVTAIARENKETKKTEFKMYDLKAEA